MGYLNRFQGCLLPYTNTGTVQKISKISHPVSVISLHGTAIRTVHSSHGVHCDSKGGETDGHTQGYKDPPVTRRQVGESQIPPSLSPTYSGETSRNVSKIRLASECRKIRGYQFDLKCGQVHPTPDQSQTLQQRVHVLDGSANSHRKASSPRLTTYETHTVAPLNQLEGTRITRKSDPHLQVSAPLFKMVAGGRKCASR